MSDLVKLLKREPFTRLTRRYLGKLAAKEIAPAEFVVLTVVADRTVSWSRLWVELSYTDVEEASGLSRRHVGRAIASLLEADLVVRKEIGQGFSYALVPVGMTGAQVLSVCDVDTAEEVGTSGPYDRGHHVPSSALPSSICIQEGSKKASGRVDRGFRGNADPACPTCRGDGVVVVVEPDGFTEAVAPCPCSR